MLSPNIRIYESYWKKDYAARAIQHLRLHWKDKGLHKRILYAGGNRVFLKDGWTNEVPAESFFVNKVSPKPMFSKIMSGLSILMYTE